jgi:CheY-like chemotaxis protein
MKVLPVETPRPCNILVLDDDPTWRRFIKFTLESELKTTALVASSGKEALHILAEHPIDVVVSDLQMPVMDGFQFLKQARIQSPTTKVIIMSAAFEPLTPTPPAFAAAGALAVISKLEINSKLVSLLRDI